MPTGVHDGNRSRAGSPNKNKDFLLQRLKAIYGNDFEPIMKMAELATILHNEAMTTREFDQVKTAVDAWEKIAQYVTPKLKSIEVTGDQGSPLILQLVNYADNPPK